MCFLGKTASFSHEIGDFRLFDHQRLCGFPDLDLFETTSLIESGGVKLFVRAVPNAKTSAILGWEDEPLVGRVLKVRIAAPAVDGKANAALIAYLAKTLKLSKSAISLTKGETSRIKQFTIPDDVTLPE